jgi:hypothetical protein
MNESKNVSNRTSQEITKTENSKNFNVTVFLTDKEQFVQDFHAFAKKTAQVTIEMCKVVYDAKHTLTNDNFDGFCREIGQKSSDSTIRKYLAIGEKYDDFINYADRLPNSWTSIYKITQIDSSTFLAMVNTDNSFATMSGKQIDLLINPSSTKSLQKISNQSATASNAISNAIKSVNSNIANNDAVDDDLNHNAEIAPQSHVDVLSDTEQDIDETLNLDTIAETEETKKSIKVNEREILSDDFHVVIKFKSEPSKAKFKEFVELMNSLRDYSGFNLDIEMLNGELMTDSSEINQQTLDAISRISCEIKNQTIDMVKK